MFRTPRALTLYFACALALASGTVAGEALVKPLPQPSLARLTAEQAQQLADARKAFDEARVNLVGEDLAAAYAQMGVLYARSGLNEVAVVALDDAAQLAPNDGRWPYLQGVLAHAQKNEAQARTYLERAYQLDQNYVPIRVALIASLQAQGDVARASKLVDDYLAKHQDQPKLFAIKGELALGQRRYAEASAAFNQALKLDPQANKLYTPLAASLQAQGDSAGAAAARAKAGDVPPRLADPLGTSLFASSSDAGVPNIGPLEQAAMLIKLNQFDGAREQLDIALKQNPQDAAVLALYARAEAAAGRSEAAQQRASAALKVAPNDALALLTQGVVLEVAGDEAGARSWYEKAVAANGDLVEPHQLLAAGAMRQGQYARAAEQYRLVVRLDPNGGEHYARLAAALSADGHCADALKELRSSLTEHPRLGLLVQAQVRVASTCRAATAQDRIDALQRANNLYRQLTTPPNSEALALAAAANGKWDDAVQLQGAAIFEVVKGGDQAEIALYKTFFQNFQAKQVPDKPWPAAHPLFRPARLQAAAVQATKKE